MAKLRTKTKPNRNVTTTRVGKTNRVTKDMIKSMSPEEIKALKKMLTNQGQTSANKSKIKNQDLNRKIKAAKFKLHAEQVKSKQRFKQEKALQKARNKQSKIERASKAEKEITKRIIASEAIPTVGATGMNAVSTFQTSNKVNNDLINGGAGKTSDRRDDEQSYSDNPFSADGE